MLHKQYTDYSAAWWQFGSIGGIFGTIVILFLLCYTIISYFQIFKRNGNNNNYQNGLQIQQQNKSVYILSIIYFSSGFLTCSIYALIRSNIITRVNSDNFSLFQCQFGYIAALIFFAMNRIFLYLVIIKRIKISFKGSIYEYQPILFLCLYWIMSIITTLNLILWILAQTDSYWILITNTSNTLSFCSRDLIKNDDSFLINVGRVCLMIIEIAFKFYLLYLFWNGLFKLYKTLANDISINSNDNQNNNNNHNQNNHNIKIDSIQHKKIKVLTELIKKQTILLFFGVSSTFIYYMFAAISFEGTTLLCWDSMVNSICIWLMFFSAEKCWRCCTKYGCCCFCYFTQNLDEYLSEAIN